MGLQVRMYLLIALMFAILYGIVVGLGSYTGTGNAFTYLIIAVVFMGIQYLIGPSMVAMMMRIRWVSEQDEPELHRMIAELARRAGIPKPRVGISQIQVPNAFAFGRSLKDGRVCVTQGIRQLLNREELEAVLGHEISHLKHRDMMIITVLSVIPLICYWVAWSFIWGGMFGGRRSRDSGGYTALIGLGAFVLYFVTNLLVLYGSRIREYYADMGSVKLGCKPHNLATALYKLVYGSARFRGKQEIKQIEGVKAFFLNDVSRAHFEIKELSAIDADMSGTIDQDELLALRTKAVKLRGTEKMMELFTTHPNMKKRIKHLSTLV